MPRFYWELVKRIPDLLWSSAGRLDKVISVGSLGLTVPGVTPLWPFSAAWALLPLAALFVYGLMKANYEAFRAVESRNEASEAQVGTDEKRRAYKESLGTAYREGARLYSTVFVDEVRQRYRPIEDVKADVTDWRERVCAFLGGALGAHQAELFRGEFGEAKMEGTFRTDHVRAWIEDRLRKLERLIEQADSAQLRPGFDPEAGRYR